MADAAYDEHEDATYGIALGFRILEEGGKFFLAEAEIAPYLDAPEELGVTIVFHPLDGLSPVEPGEEVDWPSWPIDVDEDLKIDGAVSLDDQFKAIVRQLHELTESRLSEYLALAREEAE